MKWLHILGITMSVLVLSACSDVMDSTANLIDSVANKISDDEKPKEEVTVQPMEPVEDVQSKPIEKVEKVEAKTNEAAPVVEKHDTVWTHVFITADKGNVRAEPSTDAAIVASGKAHTAYTYLAEKVHTPDGRTWYKLDYGGGIGYMSSAVSELNIFGDPPQIPGETVKIIADEGNIREEPYINSPIIYTGKKGEILTFGGVLYETGDGRDWYPVSVNGKRGYISSRVGKVQGGDEYVDSGPYEVVIENAEGNVRAKPSIDANIIYTAKKGERLQYTHEVEYTSDGRTWYGVYIGLHKGYVSSAVSTLQ